MIEIPKFIFERKRSNKEMLSEEINSALEEMSAMHPYDDEYSKAAENVEKLFRAKANEKSWKPDGNTVLQVSATLILGLLILDFEREGVVSSKVLKFLKF